MIIKWFRNLLKRLHQAARLFRKTYRHALQALFIRLFVRRNQRQSAKWNGFKITETPYDPYVRQILFDKMQKWKTQEEIFRKLIISKNPVVFDVGANVGFISLLLSRITDVTIFAFEPVSRTFDFLKINVEQNQAHMILPFNLGFSDKKQRLFIGPPTGSQHPRYKTGNKKTGLFSVHASHKGKDAEKFGEMAEFTTIDLFCEEHDLQKVSYIKIDVEGHEMNVLHGAEKTLQRFRPILQVEFHPITMKIAHRDPKELLDVLESYNYRIYCWGDGTFKEVGEKELQREGTYLITDLYCFPKVIKNSYVC